MNNLFPPIKPYVSGLMRVDDLHTLYWEECGNPNGKPILFVHGGPGAGCSEVHRRFFDPSYWRIILVDQRGAGRSLPLGETRQNTPTLLLQDFEQLRRERNVDKWVLFGGSWGSTLSLLYAQAHADRCLGLILRGIFLFRQTEIDWFLYGLAGIYPEASAKFQSVIPVDERGDLLTAFEKRLKGSDKAERCRCLRAWYEYEVTCSTMMGWMKTPIIQACSTETLEPTSALPLMEMHYFRHNIPSPEMAILNNIECIRSIPAVIVQGRYDMVCPIATADALHRAWPEAEYVIVPLAGHSALEPDITSTLIDATEKFKNL